MGVVGAALAAGRCSASTFAVVTRDGVATLVVRVGSAGVSSCGRSSIGRLGSGTVSRWCAAGVSIGGVNRRTGAETSGGAGLGAAGDGAGVVSAGAGDGGGPKGDRAGAIPGVPVTSGAGAAARRACALSRSASRRSSARRCASATAERRTRGNGTPFSFNSGCGPCRVSKVTTRSCGADGTAAAGRSAGCVGVSFSGDVAAGAAGAAPVRGMGALVSAVTIGVATISSPARSGRGCQQSFPHPLRHPNSVLRSSATSSRRGFAGLRHLPWVCCAPASKKRHVPHWRFVTARFLFSAI